MVDKQENKWKHLRPFKVQVQKWHIIFSKTLVKVIWPNPKSRDGAICFTFESEWDKLQNHMAENMDTGRVEESGRGIRFNITSISLR